MFKNTRKSLLLSILLGVLLGTLLKFFVIDIIHISGSSMEPTYRHGDAVAVSKLAYGLVIPFGASVFFSWKKPENGDIVIFMHDGKLVIKRCAGTEGFPLDYSIDNGYTLTVNGQSFPLSEEQYENMRTIDSVPAGMILAIGDNSVSSIDSRNYGFIPVKNILGKAIK